MENLTSELVRWSFTLALLAGSVWALWTIVRHYRSSQVPPRLRRMMTRFGIDPTQDDELGLHHHVPGASFICEKCKSGEECDTWLKNNPQAELPPEFCANARYLELVMRERVH